MWHFILPFTNKHHADCHLRKLSCLWKSEDVGMIILMGDESSLCCWCVIRKTIPAKKLYQPQVPGIGHPWSYVTSHSIGKYHGYNGSPSSSLPITCELLSLYVVLRHYRPAVTLPYSSLLSFSSVLQLACHKSPRSSSVSLA